MKKIADALSPRDDELVLEIGPGEGALTNELVQLGVPVRVIEIDPLLIDQLRERFASMDVEIVHGDALEIDLPDRAFRAVGNLPYNVANPIIRRTLRSRSCRGAVFMVQREVADRFVARPGEPNYGFLTVATRLRADSKKILTLGPSSFFPRPKVSSAVVRFDIRDPGLASDTEMLEEFLARSFRQRRKKLSNNLEGWEGITKSDIERVMEEIGIPPAARAETLDLHQFDRLASRLAE